MVLTGKILVYIDISGDSCLIFLSSLQPPLPLPLCQNNDSETNKNEGGTGWRSKRKWFPDFSLFLDPSQSNCRNPTSSTCKASRYHRALYGMFPFAIPQPLAKSSYDFPSCSSRILWEKREGSIVHGGPLFLKRRRSAQWRQWELEEIPKGEQVFGKCWGLVLLPAQAQRHPLAGQLWVCFLSQFGKNGIPCVPSHLSYHFWAHSLPEASPSALKSPKPMCPE